MAKKRVRHCTPYAGPDRRSGAAQRLQEIEHAATVAADHAIVKVFTSLGLDISTPAAQVDAQKDFAFLRGARRMAVGVVILIGSGGIAVFFGFR